MTFQKCHLWKSWKTCQRESQVRVASWMVSGLDWVSVSDWCVPPREAQRSQTVWIILGRIRQFSWKNPPRWPGVSSALRMDVHPPRKWVDVHSTHFGYFQWSLHSTMNIMFDPWLPWCINGFHRKVVFSAGENRFLDLQASKEKEVELKTAPLRRLLWWRKISYLEVS